MLVVAGRVRVHAALRDEAVRVALEMAQATQAENGCLSYRFYADLEDPNTFFIFEEWEDEEALARHFQSAHMAAFQRQLPRLLAGPASVKRYEVQAAVAMM